MSLEQTLDEIERRRAGFKDRRDKIDEELAARRAALLADEVSQINDLIAKARAQGATLGQIKRAYGTKDHRTITTIVNAYGAEIEYWKSALTSGKYGSWFTMSDDGATVTINDVLFRIIPVEDGIILDTDVSPWNDDFTVPNKTVGEFDGKTQDDDDRIGEILEAHRKLTQS